MKKILLVIAVILAVYLNRTYAHIYDIIGSAHLKSPDFQKVTLIKNNQGFEKTFKYVSLGDSLTSGVGTKNYQDTLPYLITKNLEKDQSNITLINLAKTGAKTRDVLQKQLPKALTENPDYITLFIGTNDIHGLVSQEEFRQNYQEIINALTTKTKASVVVINIPYLGSNRLIYFPYNLILDFRIRQFNSIIDGITQKYAVQRVDLYSKSKEAFEKNPFVYSSDQFHPSAEGYKLWEQLIDAN